MALLSILLTTVSVTAVFYDFFKREIVDELRTCAQVLQSTGVLDRQEAAEAGLELESVRITLIDMDGTVIYDNDVEIGGLDNHKDRPEVELAREQGEGQAVRRSNTLERNAFY